MQSPLERFKKALRILEDHQKTQSHKIAHTRVVDFLDYMSGKRTDVVTQLTLLHAELVKKKNEMF